MAIDQIIICPLMGKRCIEDGTVVAGELHACRFWVKVQCRDPQTGQEVDKGDCIHAWTPMLLIENSKMQRETAKAVEDFRNEMVKANDSSQQLLIAAARQQSALEGKPCLEG